VLLPVLLSQRKVDRGVLLLRPSKLRLSRRAVGRLL